MAKGKLTERQEQIVDLLKQDKTRRLDRHHHGEGVDRQGHAQALGFERTPVHSYGGGRAAGRGHRQAAQRQGRAVGRGA
jgi:hypothetical protein